MLCDACLALNQLIGICLTRPGPSVSTFTDGSGPPQDVSGGRHAPMRRFRLDAVLAATAGAASRGHERRRRRVPASSCS